jgi:hypothetical protein
VEADPVPTDPQPEAVTTAIPSPVPVPDSAAGPAAGRRLILLLSFACGVGVANIYFPQAITAFARHLVHLLRPTAEGAPGA